MKKIYLICSLIISVGIASAQLNTSSVTTIECHHDGTIEITASGGVTPYTYNWYNMDTASVINENIATGVSGGTFWVNVQDAAGASTWETAIVQKIVDVVNLQSTPADCPLSNGSCSVTVTGQAPFDYYWSDGTQDLNSSSNSSSLTNVESGEYKIEIYDANGCSFILNGDSSGFYVWSNSSMQTTFNVTASDCRNGAATVSVTNGTAPYTYTWSDYINGAYVYTAGQTVTGLIPGWISVNVLDADGCLDNFGTSVPASSSYPNYWATITKAMCPNDDGSINFTVSSGVPPFTYIWTNGATTQDITGLATGVYRVTFTDADGCAITTSKYVGESSPVNAFVNATNATCWTDDGSAVVTVIGGQSPYQYAWTNGASTTSVSSLPLGGISAAVTDVNGCHDHAFDRVRQATNCYVNLKGSIYDDFNPNCVYDPYESEIANTIIEINPNDYRTTGNADGKFNLLEAPATFDINHFAPIDFVIGCPTSQPGYSVTGNAGDVFSDLDFYDQPDTLHNNLEVTINHNAIRPGFYNRIYVTVRNHGVFPLMANIDLEIDLTLDFDFTYQSYNYYDANTGILDLDGIYLIPHQSKSFWVQTYCNANVVITTPIQHTALVGPTIIDGYLPNNYDTINTMVTGSYDPNIKEVFPIGTGVDGIIEAQDSEMEYVVHFQNTGNDTAFTVVVVDSLSDNLDMKTLRIGTYSHDMEYAIKGNRMTFTFNNINLPDSTTNEPESHGLFTYFVMQKPGLQPLDRIENTAFIYFDYNAPIVTNTTVNTIANPTNVHDATELEHGSARVYPNPFDDNVNLSINLNKDQSIAYEIYDITGKLVESKQLGFVNSGASTFVLPNSKLTAKGVYYLKLNVDGDQMMMQLIKL